MTASRIIEEIVALPPAERAAVVRFARTIDTSGQLSPRELDDLASRLVATAEVGEISVLRDSIERGFYGPKGNACQSVHGYSVP